MDSATEILAILDSACESYWFPMLDNGYIYLAATRLSLFRSRSDWAMVIEVFGFSPREGRPSLAACTFASRLCRDPASEDSNDKFLRLHPYDEPRSFYPVEDGPYIDDELVVADPRVEVVLRRRAIPLPRRDEYSQFGIELEDPERVQVFELCRYLATVAHDEVLATASEQRASVLPDMKKLLQLDEWHHPDLANDEYPSELESFRQLATVLSTGDVSRYKPTAPPNTHWKHWRNGGTL